MTTQNQLDDREIERALSSGDHEQELRELFGDNLYVELSNIARELREHDRLETRPRQRVYILPGILGSKLSRPRYLFDDSIWIDLDDLALGGVSKLKLGDAESGIYASGVVLSAYLRMKLRLSFYGFNAEFLPYDWRISVNDIGDSLWQQLQKSGERDVALVCHSMGGLVARRLAQLDPDSHVISRIITIGTPNFGSYSPVQVFRLTDSSLNALGTLDLKHTPEEIARQYLRFFPGLVEMMPSPEKRPDENYYDKQYWPRGGVKPTKTVLDAALQAKDELPQGDDRFFQIIGIGEETIQTADRTDDGLEYRYSRDGDGTVPRDLAEMGTLPRYYYPGKHGWLCNQLDVINGVSDILKNAHTDALATRPDIPRERRRTVDEAILRDLAEKAAPQSGDHPISVEDIVGLYASGYSDADSDAGRDNQSLQPQLSEAAGRRSRPRAGLRRYPTERINDALHRWHDADASRRRNHAEQRAREGRPLEAEDPDRLALYASRLLKQLKELPSAERARMPELLKKEIEASRDVIPTVAESRRDRKFIVSAERVIGPAEEFLSVLFVKRARTALKSVARVVEKNSNFGFGTGFLISPNVLITNEHVLTGADEARKSAVEFNYEIDTHGTPERSAVFDLDPESLFIANQELDFAIVGVKQRGRRDEELARYGYLPLIGVEGKIRVEQPVNIVQHPNGDQKQIVFRESKLLALPKNPDTVAQYTGDTKPGSSGSPVFSDYWEVVALHHSGVPDTDAEGNWLTKDGAIWDEDADPDGLTVRWIANEGIRVSRIVRRLETALRQMDRNSVEYDRLDEVLGIGREVAETGIFHDSAIAAEHNNTTPYHDDGRLVDHSSSAVLHRVAKRIDGDDMPRTVRVTVPLHVDISLDDSAIDTHSRGQ